MADENTITIRLEGEDKLPVRGTATAGSGSSSAGAGAGPASGSGSDQFFERAVKSPVGPNAGGTGLSNGGAMAGGATVTGPASGGKAGSDLSPAMQKMEDVIQRVRDGLLTFDEGMERLNKALAGHKDRLLDEIRDTGSKSTFEQIEAEYRTKLRHGAGDPTTRANVVGEKVLPTASRVDLTRGEQLKGVLESDLADTILGRLGLRGLGKAIGGVIPGAPGLGAAAGGRAGSGAATGAAGGAATGAGRAAVLTASPGPPSPGMARVLTAEAGAGAGAGAAAGGAGAMAGLAAAAGPVALALIANEIVKAGVKRAGEDARDALRDVGNAARGLADNDAMPALAAGSERAAGMLEKLGPSGMVAAEALKTTVVAVDEFRGAVDAFAKRGRELSGYDGRIAGAAAGADVRGLMGDIREAQRLGESYGRLIDEQSRFNAELQEALAPLKELGMNDLSAILKAINSNMGIVKTGVNLTVESINALKTTVELIYEFLKVNPSTALFVKTAEMQIKKMEREQQIEQEKALESLFSFPDDFIAPQRSIDPIDLHFQQGVAGPFLRPGGL